jgi:hypothetical protein
VSYIDLFGTKSIRKAVFVDEPASIYLARRLVRTGAPRTPEAWQLHPACSPSCLARAISSAAFSSPCVPPILVMIQEGLRVTKPLKDKTGLDDFPIGRIAELTPPGRPETNDRIRQPCDW